MSNIINFTYFMKEKLITLSDEEKNETRNINLEDVLESSLLNHLKIKKTKINEKKSGIKELIKMSEILEFTFAYLNRE